jgi:hypothetical protein
MRHNFFGKNRGSIKAAALVFFGMAAIAAVPVRAADVDVAAKEAIAPPPGAGAEEAPKRVENPEEDEFSKFTDFFRPVMPVKEVVAPVETSEEENQQNANIALPVMTVTGIVWGTKQPRAIINGEIFGEGDIVTNTEAQVKRINEAGILFLYKKKEFLMKRSQLLGIGEGT